MKGECCEQVQRIGRHADRTHHAVDSSPARTQMLLDTDLADLYG